MKNTGFKCPQPERCETHSLSQILMLTTLLFTFFSCVGSTSAGAANFALQYDGSDDFAKVLNVGNFNFSPAFTIEAWVKPASVNSDGTWKAVVSGTTVDPPSGAFGTYGWVMYLPNSDHSLWGMSVCKPGCVSLVVPSLSLKVNEWHHVAATYDGVNIKIYRDGILTNTKAQSGNAIAVNYLFIGAWLSTFNGVIDEVRVWNIARTEQAIVSTAPNPLQGDETGLVGYWTFDEGFGQFASDASRNGQAAQLGSTDGVDDQDPVWVTSDWDGSISDAEAPTIGIGFAPLPLSAGEEGTITATADDENTGGSRIVGTDYQLDGGDWMPMAPLDGAYDSILETGIATVAFPDIGTHQACVRGIDQPGNISEVLCMDIEVQAVALPPLILVFKLIPDTPIALGLLFEIEGLATDVNRGDATITGAEYRIDAGTWIPMLANDGAFDTELEQVHAFIDTSFIDLGTHSVCVRASDAEGKTGVGICKDFEVVTVGNTEGIRVLCSHKPLWPQPGETVKISMQSLGAAVERSEIWLNDNTAPIDVKEALYHFSNSYVTGPLNGERFTYGCRAKLGDTAVFSGWKTVVVGAPSLSGAIPISYTGTSSTRIDIVLVSDGESYNGPDSQEFLDDAWVMYNFFFNHELFFQYRYMFNFWIAQTTGQAFRESNAGDAERSITKPFDWEDNYAFADVGVLIHADTFRDFAQDGMFTAQSGSSTIMRHEAGHSPFGLSDEYCCDTGYFESSTRPNVYETLDACETDAPNLGRVPADCRSWDSSLNEETYYTSEPASDDLMIDNRKANAADIRRIEWLLQECLNGNC